MATTYEVALPADEGPGEVLKAYHSMMTALGIELGARYDAYCTEHIGPDWLAALVKIRGKAHGIAFHLYDPSFVLGEPLRNPSSPTRKCLPSGPAFYNLMDDLLQIRNSWNHYMVEQSLESLDEAAEVVHKVANMAQMSLGAAASALRKRIKAIRNGTWKPENNAAEMPVVVETEAVPNETVEALELEDARSVEADLMSAARLPVRPPIGGVWGSPLPGQRLRLTKLGDIVDSANGESYLGLLEQPTGPTVARWQALRPKGDLYLASEDAALVAYLAGVPRLIGYLGPEPEHDPSAIRGFAIPALYRVTDARIIDRTSGRSLSEVATEDVGDLVAEILEAVPPGGTIRVTTYGDVVRIDDAGKTKVTQVNPQQWFPGQLG